MRGRIGRMLTVLAASPLVATGPALPLVPLPTEISNAAAGSGDVIGLSAVRLCDGARFGIRATNRFPMAGMYQLPIAAAVLAQVDSGRLHLDDVIPIEPSQIVPSDGVLDKFAYPGISLSVANLIDLALTRSDNTAGDALIRLGGGPGRISAWLASHGFGEIRIDRTSGEQMRQFFALGPGPIREVFRNALQTGAIDRQLAQPSMAYEDDPRDTATPAVAADFLVALAKGKLLSAGSTAFLLDTMRRTEKANHRIGGMLPVEDRLYHKAGGAGGVTNDMAIVGTPDGTRVAVALFIKASTRPLADRETTMALIGAAGVSALASDHRSCGMPNGTVFQDETHR